jgi:hypothetical protein
LRKNSRKIQVAGHGDAKPDKSGSKMVGPADRDFALLDLDLPARPQRPEFRARIGVDQNGIGPTQRVGLALDFGHVEDHIARIESDHEYVARHAAVRIEPAAAAVVERKRGRHFGKRERLIQSPP